MQKVIILLTLVYFTFLNGVNCWAGEYSRFYIESCRKTERTLRKYERELEKVCKEIKKDCLKHMRKNIVLSQDVPVYIKGDYDFDTGKYIFKKTSKIIKQGSKIQIIGKVGKFYKIKYKVKNKTFVGYVPERILKLEFQKCIEQYQECLRH